MPECTPEEINLFITRWQSSGAADCFNKFPFPDLDGKDALRDRLCDLGKKLNAHRKARQAEHPDLTLTGMYNVLEKLRKEETLTDKDKVIHDQGLVTLLKQIHDDIDLEVCRAYGIIGLVTCPDGSTAGIHNPAWPEKSLRSLPLADRLARGDEALEQSILQFLVDLNHERAAEEAAEKIQCPRPDLQEPDGTQSQASD